MPFFSLVSSRLVLLTLNLKKSPKCMLLSRKHFPEETKKSKSGHIFVQKVSNKRLTLYIRLCNNKNESINIKVKCELRIAALTHTHNGGTLYDYNSTKAILIPRIINRKKGNKKAQWSNFISRCVKQTFDRPNRYLFMCLLHTYTV